MAINFKSGPALSLHQVNIVGNAVDGQAIEAGHVVRLVETSGVLSVLKGASASPAPAADLLGFAINTQTDGDVIESGKIGVFTLDGASIVETTLTDATINYTNYPLGANLSVTTAGEVKVATSTDKVIGQVAGIRSLPAIEVVGSKKIQGKATFLAVKLNS